MRPSRMLYYVSQPASQGRISFPIFAAGVGDNRLLPSGVYTLPIGPKPGPVSAQG